MPEGSRLAQSSHLSRPVFDLGPVRMIFVANNVTFRQVLACPLMFHILLHINPLSTKLYLSDLKTHFVPRRKHSLLRL